MVEHAFAVGRPSVLIVGLEFLDFRVESGSSAGAEKPLEEGAAARWDVGIREYFSATLTTDALSDSLLTLLSQRSRYPEMVTREGFNPMRDYINIAATEGYGTLFLQRTRENARVYFNGPKEVSPDHRRSAAVHELTSLIRVARSRGAEVHLVIYPYHAHILELFRMTGLWPAFEIWKRVLVEAVHDLEGSSDPQSSPLKLWDFSGYSQYATDPVPSHGDLKTTVQWYWEAGHFKKELGDLVLNRVLGRSSVDAMDRFGVLLSRQNIDRHLAEIEENGRRYRVTRAEEVAGLSAIVESLHRTK